MATRRRFGSVGITKGEGYSLAFNSNAEPELERLAVGALSDAAVRIAGRVRLPSSGPAAGKLHLSTKRGRGPNGAFAQVIMRGPGALAVEFGTRRSRPLAPLRRALGGR
jgi:hypothetical protein